MAKQIHPPLFRQTLNASEPGFPHFPRYGINSGPAQLARAIAVKEYKPAPRPGSERFGQAVRSTPHEVYGNLYFADKHSESL